jgi:hypothetical protein
MTIHGLEVIWSESPGMAREMMVRTILDAIAGEESGLIIWYCDWRAHGSGHQMTLDNLQPDCAGRKWSISLFDRMIHAPGTFRSARSCSGKPS